MFIKSEPFQRTDISMKPLGPTILEVLNCGFHKTKVRNQNIRRKRKTTATLQYRLPRELSISEPLCDVPLCIKQPCNQGEIFYTIAIFFAKIELMDHDNANNHIEEPCRNFVEKRKQDPNWIISNNLVPFLAEYKDRYNYREISGSTNLWWLIY
jgi:hypothetical protein